MNTVEKITLKAPGKINLLLRVTSRRADGFHELVSVFHRVPELADIITVGQRSAPGIELRCDDPDVPADSGNLIVKAAESFAEAAGISLALEIDIQKNIPVAAGMGGGSSDAGTMLKFLNSRHPVLPDETLNKLANSIGAYVPFFLSDSDAVARGTGEKLTPLAPFPEIPILAVFPAFPVRAAWAYKHLQKMTPAEQAEEESEALIAALYRNDLAAAAELCFNDLEHALFAKFPLLNNLKKQLLDAGALCVHVSGSGPVLWAMFLTQKRRNEASATLKSFENTTSGIRIMEC